MSATMQGPPPRSPGASGPRPGWLVVVGGSAGALGPAQALVGALPADLDAALVLVIHSSPDSHSHLPEILGRSTPMVVTEAVHGEPLVRGRLYCAPRDNHVLIRGGLLQVVRGPRENGHRPAVDPLFRSAAASYGAAAIGVILSGNQTCGSNGARIIRAAGGRVLAQSPAEAQFPGMPASAIQHQSVDEILRAEALSARVSELASRPPPPRPAGLEDSLTSTAPTRLSCPQCGGVLSEKALGAEASELRCRVDHRFDLDTLALEQDAEIEAALWASVRMLEEGAEVASRLCRAPGGPMSRRYQERRDTLSRQAQVIRDLLLHPRG